MGMQYQCLTFIIMLLISVNVTAGTIPLEIEAGGKDFVQYPVAVGVPFPEDEGCLDSISGLKLTKDGQEIPFQVHELCRWKNGKIKVALVQFLSDPGQYNLAYGPGVVKGSIDMPNSVSVSNVGDYVEVNTGVLRFRVNKTNGGLFDGIWLNNVQVAESGDMEAIGVDGTSYKSSNYQYTNEEVKIEESGPVRACIMIRGRYVSDQGDKNDFGYIVRIYAYAGKGFLQLSHTIIDESSTTKRNVSLKGYNIQLRHSITKPTYRFGKEDSGYYEKGTDGEYYLWQSKADEYTGNIGTGTQLSGWMDVSNGEYGITSSVRYFWENYPKGFVANSGLLKICLYPENTQEAFSGGAGIAKTHKMLLNFYAGNFNQNVLDSVGLFKYNVFPRIPSEWYCNSGVFGKILPEVVNPISHDITGYGYKYFGTLSSSCHRDSYDDPGIRDFLYYIQDSTNKNYFDKGEIKFGHCADMHIIHAEYGESDAWGNISSRGGCRGYQAGCGVVANDDRCHAQTGGSGVYYLLTGDGWAKEIITKCGECRYDNWVKVPENMSNLLLRVLQEREIGVALWRAMVAYNSTGNKRYLEGMTENVKGLIGNWKRGFWMQHQTESSPNGGEFLGRGYYWDFIGNTCKYNSGDYRYMCKTACPWMAAIMFCPLIEYDMLNKYYNFIEPSLVEDMLIGCMEHLVKYTVAEENGRIGFRREGCLDWGLDYRANRLLYPVVYLRKLSGNQQWDTIVPSLLVLDKEWNDCIWYYSEGKRLYQEYQKIGIKSVQIEATGESASITWTGDSISIGKLVYGTKKFDGNVKEGMEMSVSGNSCNLNNLLPGTQYYFQLITDSGKRTWMYTFKTKGGIDNVKIAQIEDTSATIEWVTDFEGDSIVEYASENDWLGSYPYYKKKVEQVKNHRVILEGLNKATGYHFRVKSQGQGYTAVSLDENFPTNGGISGLTAYPVDDNSATIAWITYPGPYFLAGPYDNPVNSIELSYGMSESNLSNQLTTRYGDWGVMLRKLSPNTKYYYKLRVNFYGYTPVESEIHSFFTSRIQKDTNGHQKLIGDFGQNGSNESDGKIDFEDLMWFTIYWNAHRTNSSDLRGDISGQISTTTGQPPDLIVHPDGKVDFEDLMIFTQMWNWYHKI